MYVSRVGVVLPAPRSKKETQNQSQEKIAVCAIDKSDTRSYRD